MANKSVQEQLARILEEYAEEVDKAFDKTAADVSKETVQEVKDNSPKGVSHGKRYRSGWKFRHDNEYGDSVYTIYNASKPQLTHLLEDGHVIRNGRGGDYGRVAGVKHIKPAEEDGNQKLYNGIIKRLGK